MARDYVRTIQDISINIPENISKLLRDYQVTLDVYEEVEDVFENKLFPREIVIKREILENNQVFKILQINSTDKFKINSEIINTAIIKG